MSSGITPRSMALWFFIVLVLYLGVFNGIEQWRHRHGPWRVTFAADATGQPAIVINQPRLQVVDVRIVFPGQQVNLTNLPQEIVFNQPLKPIPFGQRLHEDLLSWPGVETFDLFGHEVELLPRVLKIDRREIPWASAKTIELGPTNSAGRTPTEVRVK